MTSIASNSLEPVPPQLLQRAQQGEASAISELINQVVQPQGITVKVERQGHCLQISLRAIAPLDQQATQAFLQQGMARLQVPGIKRVRAYAWQSGEDFPVWILEFPLSTAAPVSLGDLARQGNRLALALLLSRALSLPQTTLKVALRGTCLHILIEDDPLPDRTLALDLIQATLEDLQLSQAETTKVYGRYPGEKTPQWVAVLPITLPTVKSVVSTSLASTALLADPPASRTIMERVTVEPEPKPSILAAAPAPSDPSLPEPLPLQVEALSPPAGLPELAKPSPTRQSRPWFSLPELGFMVAIAIGIYLMVLGF